MNFSFKTFLESISGLPFVFTKVGILFSVCKLTAERGCEKGAKKDIRILCYEG